jgi:prepilin-type N-terminal cleavage/methylation domain-containing protein
MKKFTAYSQFPRQRGFTLIEMMVAVALFSVVMLVTTSSLLSLVEANRKAQALHSVMQNLNIAVDGMIRAARMGTTYHCGQIGSITDPADCTVSGSSFIAFETYGGNPATSADQREYWFAKDADGIGRLYESTDGGATSYPVTAPEVNLQSAVFYVSGSTVQDQTQPKMIVIVKGIAGASKVKLQTSFTIQATASQRALDL